MASKNILKEKIKICSNCGRKMKLVKYKDKKNTYRYYICPNKDDMSDIEKIVE
jgi:hypothetical protein